MLFLEKGSDCGDLMWAGLILWARQRQLGERERDVSEGVHRHLRTPGERVDQKM